MHAIRTESYAFFVNSRRERETLATIREKLLLVSRKEEEET